MRNLSKLFIFIDILILSFYVKLFVKCDLILPIHLGQGNDNSDVTETQEEVKLDDFFWTGSGDNPPEYLKNVRTGIDKGRDVIVKTETIVATVYIDNDNDIDTICSDCINTSQDNNLNYTVMDRRYWLLTVLAGYFHPLEYPLLEERLVKLYRLAFTRQQSQHLGIINHITESTTIFSRKRRQANDTDSFSLFNVEFDEFLKINETSNSTFEPKNYDRISGPKKSYSIMNSQEHTKNLNNKRKNFNEQNIKVIIHNVSLIKENDVQNWIETRYEGINDKKHLPFANQTELIYTVFMNGKPVLATAAADDAKLITDDEVTRILENIVFMKAEPYLKEPQATPLVPANNNVTKSIITAVTHNSLFIAISSIIILLLLLLIIILILTIRAKRKHNTKIKRLSSHQRLLKEHQKPQEKDAQLPQIPPKVTAITETGVQNYGYEQDYSLHHRDDYNKRGIIVVPSTRYELPVKEIRPNSSETTGTSDSSVYCPVNKPNVDLDELTKKSSKFLEKKAHRQSSHMKTEHYNHQHRYHHEKEPSRVIGNKKRMDKKIKHKHKRKYLSENRVGSIEEIQSNLSDTSVSTDSLSDTLKSNNYDNLEHNEAYNPNNNYNRDKILKNRMLTDKVIYDTVNEEILAPKEAINPEMLRTYKLGEKSSESGSIGSFLSMVSVKSFPKSVLPEPLHRVLEPVTVTHYDHCDNTLLRTNTKNFTFNREDNLTTSPFRISHSDNQDPGVLGPVVWEIHKKAMANEKMKSSDYEPATSRTRFEGLLESAIQLYSTPETSNLPSTNDAQNIIPRPKENRGKSAIVTGSISYLPKLSSASSTRPLTADLPSSNLNYCSQTQPPTPNEKAWESRVSSPLIRPLSAGPFHRPEAPVVDVTRVLASQSTDRDQISAAPLIEAIQNELKKFKHKSTQ